MSAKTEAAIAIGVIVLGIFLYEKAKSGVVAVANAVNPLNNNNAIASGVNSVGAALTGNSNFDLGNSIYSLFHSTYNPNTPQTTGQASAATAGNSTTSSKPAATNAKTSLASEAMNWLHQL